MYIEKDYMEREDLIKIVEGITNLRTQSKELYSVMEELGIKFKKTTCIKCREDYLNVVKEELKMIEDASEVSSFNTVGYKYLHDRPYSCVASDGKRIIINQNTPIHYIEEFVQEHKGYYKQIENE
jgi:hypothetical protein